MERAEIDENEKISSRRDGFDIQFDIQEVEAHPAS
jgi:hypothetical protein